MRSVSSLVAVLSLVYTGSALAAPQLGGCPVFPADNIWNVRIDNAPLDPRSTAYVNSVGTGTGLHPDFGSGIWEGAPIGIPYTLAPQGTLPVPINFDYADESDPGPYPIPPNAAIEGGPNSQGDRHILVVEQGACKLYETFYAFPQTAGGWTAGSGAVFDLRSNDLRPDTWTSADAAGLPILAGLARCEELAAGSIEHALRFTARRTQRKYVWPARHFASSITDPNVPPMGQRFRLKAGFDTAGFSPQTRVVLQALKTYGMILADNGADWYISGAPGSCWDDDALVNELRGVKGEAFEAVDVSGLMHDPNSAAAGSPSPLTKRTLTIVKTGDGDGTVLSTPAGIACGSTCTAQFDAGTRISLTATPATGSTFVGWAGACTGTTSGTAVTLDAERNCGATFRRSTPVNADLSLTLTQTGTASVGGYLSVTARLTNLGPATATAASLRFQLPNALRFVAGTRGCRHSAGVVTCPVRAIPAGTGLVKRVRTQIAATGRHVVQVDATGTTPDPNTGNNRRSIAIVVP